MTESTPDLQKFATRLKEARRAKGLTLKDLAKKIGVSFSAIANYEQANNGPKPSTLLKLSETLDLDRRFLMGESDNPAPKETGEMLFRPGNLEGNATVMQGSRARPKTPFEPGYRSMQIIGTEKVQEHAKRLMEEEYLESPEELLNWLLRQDLKRNEREAQRHDPSGVTKTVKGPHGDKIVHRAKKD